MEKLYFEGDKRTPLLSEIKFILNRAKFIPVDKGSKYRCSHCNAVFQFKDGTVKFCPFCKYRNEEEN